MAAKRVIPIHHKMVKCQKIEEKALAAAGLRTKSLYRPQRTTYHDEDYPIGPCQKNLTELKVRYRRS